MGKTDAPQLSVLQKAANGRLAEPLVRRMLLDVVQRGGAPGLLVVTLLFAAFVVQKFTGGPLAWGLSRQALAEGRWETLASHAIAHGGLTHLWLNCAALISLTIASRTWLGAGLSGWGRYFGLLLLSAGASALFFLLIHPDDALSMVGASGAICGLWGFVVRCDQKMGELRSLTSRTVLRGVREFAVANLALFAILFLLVSLSSGVGGLAWEAHLGGFLLGILIAPWFFQRPEITSEPAAIS